jgi:hypothetical protein
VLPCPDLPFLCILIAGLTFFHFSEEHEAANLGQIDLVLLVLALLFKTYDFLICVILMTLHQSEKEKKGRRHIIF